MPRTNIERAEKQYIDHLRYIYEKGEDVYNERTGKFTRVAISLDMVYDARTNKAPLSTTRKASTKLPIAEMVGYLCGANSAETMRRIGTKSWDANANKNAAWLANPNRKGEDDLGFIYGDVARNWPVVNPDDGMPQTIDLIRKVYDNLKKGIDSRGEIITFWHPGTFHLGCLRPCMYEYQFSIVNGVLYLNVTQRSADWPLGVDANKVQGWLFLRLMAQITGLKPGLVFHRFVNAHIYEDQLPLVPEQLDRPLLAEPTIDINPEIKTLEDIETWATVNDFKVNYPEYHPPIEYPFSV